MSSEKTHPKQNSLVFGIGKRNGISMNQEKQRKQSEIKLYSASQCQELDRLAIHSFNIPSYELMTRAASAAYELISRRWLQASQIMLVCGGGNNGGDGLVLARLLKEAGKFCEVFLLVSPDKLKGDARRAYDDALAASVTIHVADDAKHFSSSAANADLIVDAILGTGSKGALRSDIERCVRAINDAQKTVLALDIPTGLNADTGCVQSEAIKSEVTLTFIAMKPGLVTGDAADVVGEIICETLGLPETLYCDVHTTLKAVAYEQLVYLLPKRSAVSHKGKQGHVLLVGGERGLGGAIALAAQAALRVGAGLVSVACHPDNAALVTSLQPEVMCRGVEKAVELDAMLERASLVALGPGLGQSSWSQLMFSKIIDHKKLRVVDADGLNWLSSNKSYSDKWVLTPHPGEAARLLSVSSTQLSENRFSAAKEIQKNYGGVCVLKGAGSIIQSASETSVCLDGNAGMASGGMGDVLTGVLAGLLAQFAEYEKMSLHQLIALAVCLHSHAADVDAEGAGERGLLASDVIAQLRKLVNPA